MTRCIMLLALILPLVSIGQKHDYVWMFSHGSWETGTELHFATYPTMSIPVNREMDLTGTNSSLCDADGNLLAYTNGIYIADKFGDMMENGDSLNVGGWAYSCMGFNIAYIVINGAFFLPHPENESRYYLFHMFVEDGTLMQTKLLYSVVDFSYNNGLGKVVEKNVPLMVGNALDNFDQATAVRHANGRDWWILLPHHMKPSYIRFLLTPNGVEGPWQQDNIGFKEPTTDFGASVGGYTQHSPDGSKFADYDVINFVQVFDFDRCTGLLSNPVKLDYNPPPNNGNNAFAGIAFSPSSRFLYVTWYWGNDDFQLVQFDTEASDMEASKHIVVECIDADTFPYACIMGRMETGPDGRIYISAGYTSKYHVIARPDMPGDACNFLYEGHEFGLDYPSPFLPYFPGYRLGPLDGSPCDTLGLDNHPMADFHWDANGLGVLFTDESYYAPETWHWDFGDGGTSNEQHPQHSYASAGEYYACLVVSNQFSSDTVCQWVRVDSLTDTSDDYRVSENSVDVSPNPASESVKVTLQEPLNVSGEWVLSNAMGVAVRSTEIPAGAMGGREVSLSGLVSGLYFWQLKAGGGVAASGKLVITR